MNDDINLDLIDEETEAEPEAEEEQPEAGPGVYTHTYSPPFKFGGETYEKVRFNFAKLTGNDVRKMNGELRAKGHYPLDRRFDLEYQVLYSVRCSEPVMPADAFYAQPARDFEIITAQARFFLTR